MTKVCIYRPTKTAMQSGRAQTRDWVLEFDAAAPKEKEPLMGWTSCRDTRTQVALRFQTKEAAVRYAERRNFAYQLVEPKTQRPRPKSYAANFK